MSSLLLTPDCFTKPFSSSVCSVSRPKNLSFFEGFKRISLENNPKSWISKERSNTGLYVAPYRKGVNEPDDLDFVITDEEAAKLIGPYGIEIKKIRTQLESMSTRTTVDVSTWNNGENRIVTISSYCENDIKKAKELILNRINA